MKIKLENEHTNKRYRHQSATEAKSEKTEQSDNWSHIVIYSLKKAHEVKWKITQVYILTALVCSLLKEYLSVSTPSDSSFVTSISNVFKMAQASQMKKKKTKTTKPQE